MRPVKSLSCPEMAESAARGPLRDGPLAQIDPKGPRCSGRRYGICCAVAAREMAIAETVPHFEVFVRDGADPPRSEDIRVLAGIVAAPFEDVFAPCAVERAAILDPKPYAASQACGKQVRPAGANGLDYPSLRHVGGQCHGALWPRPIGIPYQERHLECRRNGERVDRDFDHRRNEWIGQ